MKTKKYTLSEIKQMLVDFNNNHPKKGEADEWYGDVPLMTTDCVSQFIQWLEKGDYDGGTDSYYTIQDDDETIIQKGKQ